MSDIEKTYIYYGSGMNSDDDIRYISEGDGNLGRLNITITQDGSQGLVKTIDGNTRVFKSLPRGINKCIGAIDNVENKSIVYFIYNSSSNHRIYEYRPFNDDSIDLILKSEVGANFNWTSNTQISGVVTDGICYFNDPIPKVVNLAAARIVNSYVYNISSSSQLGYNGDGIYLLDDVYYEVLDSPSSIFTGDSVLVTLDTVV